MSQTSGICTTEFVESTDRRRIELTLRNVRRDRGGRLSRSGAVEAHRPFHDTDREVLPEDAWRFILYFAKQAKGPFLLLLIIGGLAGAVDAALYWSVGWLIDLLDIGEPGRRCFPTTGRNSPVCWLCCSSSAPPS